MRKRNHETTEYIPEWDAGSYHTGPAKPPKRSSGLIAALLIAVICLGGLASAFGILNFRLLAAISEHSDSLTPLDTHNATVTTDPNRFLDTNDDPAPVIPAVRDFRLLLDNSSTMTVDQRYSYNEQSLVSVYCTTYCNETLSGTGVILSEDGFILVNSHVLEAAQRIFVYLPEGKLLRASLVGSDPFTDLAVLYVQATGLTPALFAGTQNVCAEDPIRAMREQPDADHNFMVSGKIYALTELSAGCLKTNVLQTNLWGDSGPVFNSQGHIIAIQAGKIVQYFDDETCTTHGLAIPSEIVQQTVNKLIEEGYIENRPVLGIQVEAISKLYQHYWELPGGLLVTQIEDSCNAIAQGLQEGDILLTLDGTQLLTRADLYTVLYASQIGDELTAAVFRDGRKFTITLTVEENQG